MENQFKPGDIIARLTTQPLNSGFYEIICQNDDVISGKRVGSGFAGQVCDFSATLGFVIPWNYDEASQTLLREYILSKCRSITDDDWIYRVEVNGVGFFMDGCGLDICKKAMCHPGGEFHSVYLMKNELSQYIIDRHSKPGSKIYRYIMGSVAAFAMDSSFIDHSKPYERIEIASF
jgi:hypothetical protein